MNDFESILEGVLAAPTIPEIKEHGEKIKSQTFPKEDGSWNEVNVYKYGGNTYIEVYNCTENNRECIQFEKVR